MWGLMGTGTAQRLKRASIKMRTSHTRKTCTVAIRLCSPNDEVEIHSHDFTRRPRSLGHCSIGVRLSGRDYLKGLFLGTLQKS